MAHTENTTIPLAMAAGALLMASALVFATSHTTAPTTAHYVASASTQQAPWQTPLRVQREVTRTEMTRPFHDGAPPAAAPSALYNSHHTLASSSNMRATRRAIGSETARRTQTDLLMGLAAAVVAVVTALVSRSRKARPNEELQLLPNSAMKPMTGVKSAQPSIAMMSVTGAVKAPFSLPKLAWGKDELAPHISHESVNLHYGKHHQSHITKLNELLQMPENAKWKNKTLDSIVLRSSGAVFNQAAQIWNHNFYWRCLRPNPTSQENIPIGAMKDLIERDFGSFEAFKEKFTDACAGHFGSGWMWLVLNRNKKLEIITGHDASNPIKDGTGTPLLTLDVWEHAYYTDHRNSRAAYVDAWWNLVNWDFATVAMMAATQFDDEPDLPGSTPQLEARVDSIQEMLKAERKISDEKVLEISEEKKKLLDSKIMEIPQEDVLDQKMLQIRQRKAEKEKLLQEKILEIKEDRTSAAPETTTTSSSEAPPLSDIIVALFTLYSVFSVFKFIIQLFFS